ncbi:hypothetical protein B0T18DRAFT_484368 [Schizothecium vesticola]|uniref:Beta/gamma crystallin 'Greek key' domain-containing protein n=1 Tax=Schizothecium vesticola TaxID=314040 RepID=A0AA40F9R5_9PEZI|nr:hypothetical protein B0T18DRAFT_484368 [Schizothecium vesticola]
MPSLKSLLAILPLALSAMAAPSPAPFEMAYANDTDVEAASRRAVAIDENGRNRIIICNDARRGGQCLNWGQKGHCWDFRDSNLAPYNDAVSSVYPQEAGVVWVLYQDYDCKGATLQVTSPGIDNLADVGFNDRVSSFSWFLR